MAKERKKVETKEVVPEPRKKVEPKKYVRPEPRRREVAEPKPEVKEEPKPKTKKKPEPVKEVKAVEKKKLTKKQIEKKIESEKDDTSVPQLPPKKNEMIMVPSTPKTKRSEDKYISIAENAKMDERKIITDKIIRNELVFSHYCVDGDLGYHYYRVLINNK